jgi:hypothetical protein
MVGHDEVAAHLAVLGHGASLSNAHPKVHDEAVACSWLPRAFRALPGLLALASDPARSLADALAEAIRQWPASIPAAT